MFRKTYKEGNYNIFISGIVGNIETILTVPKKINNYSAFLGHPHPLKGGTMHNKVITTLARTFKELGIISIRFNFRGVGQSSGYFSNGIGESKDMIYLSKIWKKYHPNHKLIFAGFSFGSYVAYRTSSIFKDSILITIAPPITNFNYLEFNPCNKWIILQGENDNIVQASEVYNFSKKFSPPIPIIFFKNTDHFFHGKLIELRNEVKHYLLNTIKF